MAFFVFLNSLCLFAVSHIKWNIMVQLIFGGDWSYCEFTTESLVIVVILWVDTRSCFLNFYTDGEKQLHPCFCF
jgi:hypothetical protein